MIRKVFKFGGASVKTADAVKNLRDIVAKHKDEGLLLVVSAMGKTTNALEKVLAKFRANNGQLDIKELCDIYSYHDEIIKGLFGDQVDKDFAETIAKQFIELWDKLKEVNNYYDYQYDQTVCYGEIISTLIIDEFLNYSGIPTRWLDAQKYVIAKDNPNFRSANVDWDETRLRINPLQNEHTDGVVYLTQGFIGGTSDGKHSVTLGREGSDYTAAIFANCLDAEEVTIWKDVDGLRNADPKRFITTTQLTHITYPEAIELAFYGASIIHPKTIKPLQNKGIPLKVQSFLNPDHEPSVIDGKKDTANKKIPSYIVKDKQTLVSFSPRDYSFMNEHNLQLIFDACDQLNIHANVIQTSALMLSFCFDHDEDKLKGLVDWLGKTFAVTHNKGLTLFTVRHYDNSDAISDKFLKGKKVYLEQSSRSTKQFVIES